MQTRVRWVTTRRVPVVLLSLVVAFTGATASASAAVVKVIADDRHAPAERALSAQGAVVERIDYGSFRVLAVDEQVAGGRAAIAARGLEVREDMDQILLGRYRLDTRRPTDVERRLRGWQRRDELARAKAQRRAPRDGLYLVQFAGPVRSAWLDDLGDAGLEIVSYVPENAYVVRARGAAAARLRGLPAKHKRVQYVGDFHPAYRITEGLRAAADSGRGDVVDVLVQVVDGPGAAAQLASLRALAADWVQEHRVLNFRNVEMAVDVRRLAELASKEYVFHVEERTARTRHDEAQSVIVAGLLTGNSPTAPGYVSWLNGKGFNASQFGTFAINVADDATSLTGHPDLASNRILFQNNPTSQTGAQGGHGFLNAHIVAGINTGTGAAFEDTRGYNYGLGVAPFANVGATAIFGNGTATSTAWENSAYAAGARISTNSWGFTGAAARRYDADAQEYDRIVRDAQPAVAGSQPLGVVFAAGNSGSASNTVSSPGTAKNVITVGAGENDRQTGTDGCSVTNTQANSANDIVNFSSRGPVNTAGGDGRVKPDLMAPGTHIEGGVPQSNYDGSSVCNKYWPFLQTLYGWSSGTSHSTPAVAGGAALVYQDFLNKGRPAPSPAMVKAYLMNSAAHMTGVGANDTLPSNNQGMGRMNLGQAFDGAPRVLVDQTQLLANSGATYTTSTTASGSGPLRVTLAWTDAPGPTVGAPYVNNLDLEVTVGATTYKGNVFSGAGSAAGGTADSKNNVESVFIPSGASGAVQVTVRATNIAGDAVPGNADTTDQDFALVVRGATTSAPAPTIGVSPSSFSFSATAGGANPGSQTLNITNTGGGTLNWSASDNATWLTVTPTTGTAPSSTTLSVNTTGLAAGTYNATVTITSTGATNSPVSVPVTLVVNSAPSAIVANGGFEGGIAPWTLSGHATYTQSGPYPHGGTGYVSLGERDNANGSVYQTITIPSTATSANLRFWLNVSSFLALGGDRLFVEIRSPSGALLATPATFTDRQSAPAGSYTQRGPYSLLAWKGQSVVLTFRVTTDFLLPTTFRIDDVAVT